LSAADPSSIPWFLGLLLVVSFGLNWLWEMLQMSAYVGMAGRAWRATIFSCALASLGDAAITLLIYGAGALATRRTRRVTDYGYKAYVASSLAGATSAVVIEWIAQETGRWTYTSQMPVMPLLDIGLWPLLQLAVLVPLALWLAAWWEGKHRQADSS
jgi:hypothetical protein